MHRTILALMVGIMGIMLVVHATLYTTPFILLAGAASVVLAVLLGINAGRKGE